MKNLLRSISLLVISAVFSTSIYAAQTGDIKGKVTSDAVTVEGATVTATSNVMPRPRTTTVGANGNYNLPSLLPGTYEVTLTSTSGVTETATVNVLLGQTSVVDFTLDAASDANRIVVIGSSLVIREGDSSINNSISQSEIENLPIGEQYRDILKLIPGVQYSENSTLGPNAGGSGRDNTYGFDGVDVSLPMFGNLSAEPSTHDIQNVSIDRGAARAVGFNRSGGFAINTISKSGTNEFEGKVEYKIQDKSWVADRDDADNTKYTLDQSWITASFSGPIIEDNLFFYASYYNPEVDRVNKETTYGSVQDYNSSREEIFGKLTWAPIDEVLLNISMRTSDNESSGDSICSTCASTTGTSSDAYQDIMTVDGTYIVSDSTTINFAYSEFDYETFSAPDIYSSAMPSIGGSLDLTNLDSIGRFYVPSINANQDAVVAQSLINTYGYLVDGTATGGGVVGYGSLTNDQSFYRDSFEINLEHEFMWGETFHTFHIGYQWKESTEVLRRLSNGWGSIYYLGGEVASDNPFNAYYQTITQQASLSDVDSVDAIVSSSESNNIEINDIIEDGDFTYNIGVLISKDVLYGQGLKPNASNVSGYENAPGYKYEMYATDWSDMIQPRLGVTWAYDGENTVFANFAKYNPEVSSLARAASWDRNILGSLVNIYFDESGQYLGSESRDGSSGKFFVPNMTPRQIEEITVGTAYQVSDEWYLRSHLRRREGSHFWEDVPNNAREYGDYGPVGGVPADIAARGLYIPELADYRAEVGGSSYVIAEMDSAFTSYNEFSFEAEYNGDRTYAKISYVWSNYYGNYDQDNTSTNPDANLFVGSSNYGDGRGRLPWDNKYGKLYGDRPHVLKLSGYYTTDWDANVGIYAVWQSGNVWNAWSGTPWGYSSDTIRYAEPPGSRREPSHWQLDLNYTQDFELSDSLLLSFRADIFNLFDNQTGYAYDPVIDNTNTFGTPTRLINPRRFRLAFSLHF